MFIDPFASLDTVLIDYDTLKDTDLATFNKLIDAIATDPLSSAKLMSNRRGDVDERIKKSVASDIFASRQYASDVIDPSVIPSDIFSTISANPKFVFEISNTMASKGFEVPKRFDSILSNSPSNAGAVVYSMYRNGITPSDILIKAAAKTKHATIQIADYLEYTDLPTPIKNSIIRHVPYKYYTMNMDEISDADRTKIEKSMSKMSDVRRKSKYNRFTCPKIATLVNYIKKSNRFPEPFEEFFISDPMYIDEIAKFNIDLIPHNVLDVYNKYTATIQESSKFDYYYGIYSAD